VRLCGAAERLRETIGASLAPTEQEHLEQMLSPARKALGEAAVSQAVADGRAMSLEQAIAYSLQTN
jgi:hypothetical protein